MEYSRQLQRDDFLRKLSVYSNCIQPYLRNIQDKYGSAYYLVTTEPVDLRAYCTNEYEQAINAKKALEKSRGQWIIQLQLNC